jgi:hypothetical protein
MSTMVDAVGEVVESCPVLLMPIGAVAARKRR